MAGVGFSGKDGDIKIGATAISEIKAWTFNPKSTNPRYASGATGGYKRTVAGVKEGSGTMTGVYSNASPHIAVIDVGTSVTLKLYLDTTHFFSVPSVIDDYKMNVDIDSGEIVGWEGAFSTDGAWTNPVSPLLFDPSTAGAGAAPGAMDAADINAKGTTVDIQALKDAGFLTSDQRDAMVQAAKDAVRELLAEFVATGQIQRDPKPPADELPTVDATTIQIDLGDDDGVKKV